MRARAESLMSDTCRITRPGDGDPVFDPNTGTYTDPPPVTVYEGKCRFNVPGQIAGSQTASGGDATWTVQDSVLSLPIDGPGYTAGEEVGPDQTVECLTAAYDATLPGHKFGVVAAHRESQATARRLRVREVTG
jgi:hypothetical protein